MQMKGMERWPAESLESVSTCPICQSAARSLLHAAVTDDAFRAAPGDWVMWRCESCKSGYLDPRPTRDSIGLAYETYYTHGTHTVSQGGVLKRAVLASAYGYLNARYGLSLQPASYVGGWFSRFVPPFRGFLDAKLRHLPHPTPGALLLDVGCGHGDFLDLARQAGWQVHGLDFDARAVEAARARAVEVFHGDLAVLDSTSERYDYITLSHVIEHLHQPADALTKVWRLLKPGGTVWIDTPNIDALGHRRFGRYWRGLEAPRHLAIFSPEAMTRALTTAGFETVRARYRGTMVPLAHAESEAFSRGLPLGSIAPWRQRIWPCLIDTLVEEFVPARREFITVTATKPGRDAMRRRHPDS